MSSSPRYERMSSSLSPAPVSGQKRGAVYWVWIWLPVALGIAMILVESTEMMGADHTSGPLRAIYQAIFGHVSNRRWDDIHHYIRKTGHFIGYGLIGLAWLRAWWFTLPHSRFFTDMALAMLGTAAIASSDEWHQSVLPNRSSSIWDVLLDCCGALTLQLIVYIYMRLAKPKKLARAA
jgi:VanZ family protein